ncbi:hypothetical protein ABC345_19955 [Shouchella sp. 1P09AA]|uniref:hypothetical protein n=1 Tax=unclassified Shouchella TaxID=2893065 RepID=UPI0039A1A30E
MKNVWRMHIKPDTKAGLTRNDAWSYCVENGIIGIGWGIEENVGPMLSEEYLLIASKVYKDNTGWKRAMNAFIHHMKLGDLVWLEYGGVYYISELTGDAFYDPKRKDLDLYNTRSCRIKEIGGLDVVPGGIQTRFIRGSAIQKVNDSILQQYTVSTYFGKTTKVRAENLLKYLSPDDLEDLVGLYLQYRHDYKVIPSSCKPTTKKIEYTLIREGSKGKIETAAVQVKKGNVLLSVGDYADLPYDWVYLFGEDENYRKSEVNNVKCLTRKELIDFITTYRSFLPNKITHWLV